MSVDNEQLKPTPFDVAPAPETAAVSAPEPSRGTPQWILPALGGLLLLAVVVVFWLPSLVSPPEQTAETADSVAGSGTADTAAKPGAQPDNNPSSPWSDAQDAKLRKGAQDVLAQLLDIQFTLEERNVALWASEPFAAANATALEGDELYRQREYEQATEQYQRGLEQLMAISDSMPQRVDELLQQTRDALQEGTPDQVAEALELAALIEPENAALPDLQRRAANYPALLEQLAAAEAAEAAGDLATAKETLAAATALDAEHLFAASELERVGTALTDQQFNAAMSEGYAALDDGEFNTARQRFKAAAALRPGSSEASSALQELAGAEQGATLVRLQREGARHEQNEAWQKALTSYQRALKIDSNVSYASEGASRAAVRAELDKQLRAVIDAPERLSDIAVAQDTALLLAQAREVEPRGPVLSRQIDQLDTLVQRANTQVQVILTSDEQTEVIVYKVARLGRFQQRELTLRPGTYTVRGSRNGYRDVLEKITITPDGPANPILIACREPIN
ncbi:hypothetical protein EY643_02135 [Halioglobus maricola]|uniref:Tetratricopeptide repeat protein n=1 Tax=Halioglobus maricola TaxID=2601894 RepID=A0A5P9NH55_9GAMM|nr:hypothetical protein [Halioglobus maricola]QFU74544.1 hypothetical protein EY643_02135 [Halioglobus maricola]